MNLFPVDASASGLADAHITANVLAETILNLAGLDRSRAEALCRAAGANLILAPATSRFMSVAAGVAHRLNGCVDAHVTSLEAVDGTFQATAGTIASALRASFDATGAPGLSCSSPDVSGCGAAWTGASGRAKIEEIPLTLPEEARRTVVTGVRAPNNDGQTEPLIPDFLRVSGASLGGGKSLIEQSGETNRVRRFMTPLNTVGRTGSTPRHCKGLSTCCQGEEPHVVGWRFLNQRRAVNLDPNCGWARGKADVLYVADALGNDETERSPGRKSLSVVETEPQLARSHGAVKRAGGTAGVSPDDTTFAKTKE